MLQRQNKKTLATDLRHYVYLQTKSETSDGEGGFVTSWTSAASPYSAGISPIQARQVAEYKSINVDASHIIRMRGELPIKDDGTQRLLYGTRTFEILTVEDIQERGVMKIITCKEAR
jgi:head-tail adaptor